MANVIQIVISALNKTGQGLTAPIKDLQSLEKSLGNLKPAAVAVASAVGAATVYMASKFLSAADAANKSSQAIGMSTEAFTSLAYAAKLGGVSTEEFEKHMAKLSKAIVSASGGSGAAADAFKAMGVSVQNSDGTFRSVDDVFLNLADRFSRMESGAQKTAAAMEIFGKGGAQMIPVLNSGAAGIRSLQEEADALGVTISTKTGIEAERLNDALERLHASTQGMVNVAMAELVPALANAAEAMVKWEKENGIVTAAAKTLVDIVKTLATGANVLWAALNVLAVSLAYIADVIYSMVAVQVDVAIQLFKRWAVAVVEVGRLIKDSASDIKTFAEAMSAVARGDFITASALASAAWATSKDNIQGSFDQITAAAVDSGKIISSNTAQFLGTMSERWKVFADDQVGVVASMMGRINGLNSTGASAIATRQPSAGGVGAPSGNDGSSWIDQIVADSYKASDMLKKLRVEALEGASQQRAAEMLAYEEKLQQIDSLAIYEDQKRQLREAAEEAHSKRMGEISKKEWQKKLAEVSNYTGQFGSMLGSLATLAAASGKKNFAITQALRYGEAIMNTASGVSRAFADYKWPYSMIVAAAVGAAGAAQIATIAAQKAPSYAVGSEYIPATGPAVVHQGERIVQSDINADLTEFLRSGSGGGPTHVTILLDGEVLARAMGNMSRDGRLELSARAIA